MSNDRPVKSQKSRNDDGTVIIISNRGPHDFVWQDGKWVAKASTGGLVAMIEPLARQPDVAWFCCVSEPPESEADRDALYVTAKDQTDAELNVFPVPVPADIYRDYYGEISNEVLWMLQHRLVGEFGYRSLDQQRHAAWKHYLDANRRMADAVVATGIPVRAFLIEDYHLYPLPALLRERFPAVPCLHFVHIPFSDPATLKLIPAAWRQTILAGLLGADVVGLQTPADVRSFLGCCQEILGATVDWAGASVKTAGGRVVRVRAFAASIDPAAVAASQASREVETARRAFGAEVKMQTIVRVDRLDPSKNQILGFTAFGRLLEANSQYVGRVRFVAVLVPSRTDLTVYREYRDAVYREIERVNAQFKDACGFEPIQVVYTNDVARAFAAMEQADVFLANPRQDGTNLMVKKWAILSERPGALVLSETSGVAAEAAGSALFVCPLDVEGTARTLADALAMPRDERRTRLEHLRAVIHAWTARDWLEGQLKEIRVNLAPAKKPRAEPARTPLKPGAPLERELAVVNELGIHARPAAAFVRCARKFDAEVQIVTEAGTFSAKSILEVLTANLNYGTKFLLRTAGADAAKAADALDALLRTLHDEEET